MSEDEWKRPDNLHAAVAFAEGKLSRRKVRLFACALARRLWHLLPSRSLRACVDVVEQYVEGLVPRSALAKAGNRAQSAVLRVEARYTDARFRAAAELARTTAFLRNDIRPPTALVWMAQCACTAGIPLDAQKKLLEDILGPALFGSLPALDPSWLAQHDRGVPRLAQPIYAERAFDRLPILGDALEEAGCTDEAILAHCRGPGPHVRGCWVVDLVLRKE